MENYIPFKKRRELGEILSDTFKFIRYNFKSLLNILIKTAGIPFLLLLIAQGYYAYTSGAMMENGSEDIIFDRLGAIGLLLFFWLIYYVFASSTVLHYIRNYESGKGTVQESEVIREAKSSYGSLFGLGLLAGIMISIGLVFFVIPGIYLFVPLSLAFALMIMRNTEIGAAINQSFTLVTGYWWVTFGTLLVCSIIISMISYAFQIPTFIYIAAKTFIAASESSLSGFNNLFDLGYVLLSVFGSAASYILYIVYIIATAFIYFDLNEEKHKSGVIEQIDELG